MWLTRSPSVNGALPGNIILYTGIPAGINNRILGSQPGLIIYWDPSRDPHWLGSQQGSSLIGIPLKSVLTDWEGIPLKSVLTV